MTLIEAEALAKAYVTLNIPARTCLTPDRPGYGVLVRFPGREPFTLYDNPLIAQALLNVPTALISETPDEAPDSTVSLYPGDDAGGQSVSDPGGGLEADPALEKLLANIRGRNRAGSES